jgi:hypothetical protein
MNEKGIDIPDGLPYDRQYAPYRWSIYALLIGMTLTLFVIAWAFISSMGPG